MAEDSGSNSGLWGAAIAGGLSLLGSMGGSETQAKYNAKEAQRNRDWQTEMSNTAYQRAANDLEKAGLNRILALGSPASTPSGATASIEAPKLAQAVSTGIAAASANQQIEQSKATEALQKEQKNTEQMKQHLLKEQTEQSASQTGLNRANARYSNAKATGAELYNPVQKLGNEVLEKLTDFGRGAAKEYKEAADAITKRGGQYFNTIKRK